MDQRQGLTVRELLEESGLQLSLLAGTQSLDTPIEAVYVGDMVDPTRWMVRRSLLLTCGPQLENDPAVGVNLIRRLREAEMVGVGVAIEPYVHEIPPAMVHEADKWGVVLLRVPPETLFREIAKYVFSALSSRDMHQLRRQVGLQTRLLEATIQPDNDKQLIATLGSLLDADVILFSAAGDILARSPAPAEGPLPRELVSRIWKTYCSGGVGGTINSRPSIGPYVAHFRDVRAETAIQSILAAVHPNDRPFSDFAEAALSFAQKLVQLTLAKDRLAGTARRKTRARLLARLLRSDRTPITEDRLLAHGLMGSMPVHVAVLSPTEPGPIRGKEASADERRLLSRLDDRLEETAAPFLSMADHGLVVALSADAASGDEPNHENALRDYSNVLASMSMAAASCGVSSVGTIEGGIVTLLAEALLANLIAEQAGGGLLEYGDLTAGYRVVNGLPRATLSALAEPIVTALTVEDEERGTSLLPTMKAYLDNDGSVGRTAATCYLHPNSVRKRLRRIQRLVDVDLTTLDGLLEMRLRLIAAETLRARARYPDLDGLLRAESAALFKQRSSR